MAKEGSLCPTKGSDMLLKISAYMMIASVAPIIAAGEVGGRDVYSDLIAATPIGAAMIAVVWMFLRHLEGVSKAMTHTIDRNTDSIDRLEATIQNKM